MTDRILAVLALLAFALYVGIIIVFVPHPDLVAVVLVVTLMTTYDFWREIFRRGNDE